MSTCYVISYCCYSINPECGGFLGAYGLPIGAVIVATVIYCSNSRSWDKPCDSKYMFSLFSSKCGACFETITVDDVITVSYACKTKQVWVHYACANKVLMASPEKPIQCLKCLAHIFDFEDREPTSFGRSRGFKHMICPTSSTSRPFKRRIEILESSSTYFGPPLSQNEVLAYTSSHSLPEKSTADEQIES